MPDAPLPEVLPPAPPPAALPAGVQPSRNYVQAVELGRVLAASGYYTDARDPAKAAVKVMIGMDLGVSPTAAIQAIHTMEDHGRIVFLIEAKLLAAVVKARPDVEYRIVERSAEKVEAEFLRRGEDGQLAVEGPNIVWTLEDAKKAVKGFDKKPTWQNQPAVMLTWRVLSEGFRLYFPDVLAGQPLYTLEEFDTDAEDARLADRLEGSKPPALNDARAEELRQQARAAFEELREVNPTRMAPGRFHKGLSDAEHSHAALESLVGTIEELRDTEREILTAAEALVERLGEAEAKPIIERAERRPNNRERLEVLNEALRAAESGSAPPAGDSPGEEGEGPQEGAESAGEGS